MTTVWRYERDGVGPYNAEWQDGRRHHDMAWGHTSFNGHPAWNSDMPIDRYAMDGKYASACRSREQLDQWFEGWLEDLKREGFECVTYDVPESSIMDGYSGRQCAAPKEDMTARKVHA